jgi:aryl-phospho-beta-D-glucosidase BglC (GH1 family)
MKDNPMKRTFCLFLCVPFSLWAQESIITFHAINAVTWETVVPDSIYIQNITQGWDTMLVETSTFDLSRETGVSKPAPIIPDQFQLVENFPNPFTDRTETMVHLPVSDEVDIQIFNILGQRVARFSSRLPTGSHGFQLRGGGLPNGLYLIRAVGTRVCRTIKMLKTGRGNTGEVVMNYTGLTANPQFSDFLKMDNAGDNYAFTAYAGGFYPKTLDDQTPAGGETIEFELEPVPPPDDFTSHWFGFNLLGKFTVEWSDEGYLEEDFQMLSDLGFNFVRLPIDYRTYTVPGDWYSFDADGLADIDDAVAWGQEYGVHVSINLHRAPGYCVNPPGNPLPPDQNVSLWNNSEAQHAFAAHWRMFAERFQDVPCEVLSFNLVNEPSDVDGDTYVIAVLPAIQAIREVSPDRIIISDAVEWGNARVDEILDYGVVMSPHFYNPFQITHYKAEWVDGSDSWPEPSWPPQLVSTYFYGSYKSPWNTPLEIEGDFPAGTEVTLLVNQVSTSADFRVSADGTTVYTHQFSPGPGTGEWQTVIYAAEWNIYQNIYNREYTFALNEEADKLSMKVYTGDWMTFSWLRIVPPQSSGFPVVMVQPGISDWGVPQASYFIDEEGSLIVLQAPAGFEDLFKMNGFLDQWIELKRSGTPVHVGEWGVYNKTPHEVTLQFMENRLMAMKSAGLGWALWNFRGSFGVLDSGRADVNYENYHGHQLDRQMLNLLLEYVD